MNNYSYTIAYCLFILAIHFLSTPKIAYKGNLIASIAMLIAIIINIPHHHILFITISILSGAFVGLIFATRIKMQNLPQMVAILNGFGGLSAGLIGIAELKLLSYNPPLILFTIILGFITFSGSIASFHKLNNRFIFNPKITKIISILSFLILCFLLFIPHKTSTNYLIFIVATTLILGFSFIEPIGGADMPIIISILNSLSGWTTVLIGFNLNDYLLIITGTIVGSSGTILTYIMTKSMNRSLIKLLIPKTNTKETLYNQTSHFYNQANPTDAAFLMENAHKVIIVPGYGMASANAQHELVNLAEILKNKYNVDVKFAIHPVAGRMPGHMNVLLAEADADINTIFELKDINQEFQTTDVVYIIGANDITNPLAKTLKDSPIYQMPILDVEQAKKIIFVKRSLSPGYAGIDNPLFYNPKTLMLLGDAKEITKQIVAKLE